MATQSSAKKPIRIAVDKVHRSESDPRLYRRNEVIEGIRVQLERDGELPLWHAIVVRPRGAGGYELLAGHHRMQAVHDANENGANIREVPAWIREDLKDDEANRFRVLSNLQAGLSDLELGLFLIDEFPDILDRRHTGRGVQGGARNCAKKMGVGESKVRRCREAALVFQNLQRVAKNAPDFAPEQLEGKASHLAEIARVPVQELWQYLAGFILREHWSVDRTRRAVRMIRNHFVPILQDYQDWRTEEREPVVASIICDYAKGDTSLQEALTLVRRYAGVPPSSPTYSSADRTFREPPSDRQHRLLVGDALQVLPCMDQESIDLVVTSPPWYNARHIAPAPLFADFAGYGDFLGVLARQLLVVLAEGRFCCIHIADITDPDAKTKRLPLAHTATREFLSSGFEYHEQILVTRNFPSHSRSAAHNRHRRPSDALFSLHDAILVFRKPGPEPFDRIDPEVNRRWLTTVWDDIPVAKRMPGDDTPRFRAEIPHRLISIYSQPGDRVLDPFAGTGTTLVEAAGLKRDYVGIECREEMVPTIQSALPRIRVGKNGGICHRAPLYHA
ncbi:MAG: ParB N-terminal domain-containing protein [Lentisphaeria bacterium]|nr:ParB N-terminal domain-containing protein [Lentisphaeria bacterium]